MNQRRPLASPLVRPFWAVEIELLSLVEFDASCAARGLTREQGVREACAWLTARSAVWVERSRQRRIAELQRQANSWDPISDYLRHVALSRSVSDRG